MNCNYYDNRSGYCRMKSLYSDLEYKPTEDELQKLCCSPNFPKCKRLKTFHAQLSRIAGKDGAFLANPELYRRPALADVVRRFIRALSPRPELRAELLFNVDELVLENLESVYRENYKTEIALRKMKFGDFGQAIRTDILWDYEIHNTADHPVDFTIPLRIKTHSFAKEGLPIEEHVVIREIISTTGNGDPVDLVRKYNLGSLKVVEVSDTKVGLDMGRRAIQTIPPESFSRICLNFSYVNRLQDNHLQRMLTLTRNLQLKIDYDEAELFVDVGSFCLPPKQTRAKGHLYSWQGWLFSNHGFFIDWFPVKWRPSPLKEKMGVRKTRR